MPMRVCPDIYGQNQATYNTNGQRDNGSVKESYAPIRLNFCQYSDPSKMSSALGLI
jgi:hypothetical protein